MRYICPDCLLAFNTQTFVLCMNKRCDGVAELCDYMTMCYLLETKNVGVETAFEIITTPCGALIRSDDIIYLSNYVVNYISSGRSPKSVVKLLLKKAREDLTGTSICEYPFLNSIYIARSPYYLFQQISEKNPEIF